jgi:hypothetical protein
MRSIPLAVRALRELGLSSVAAYAWYEIQKKSGWLRFRTPLKDWEAFGLETLVCNGVPTDPIAYLLYRLGTGRLFFFNHQADLSASLRRSMSGTEDALLTEADEILEGHFRLFGGPSIDFGSPPDWHTFPAFDLDPCPDDLLMDVHWTELDLDDFPLDIKLLWEPARFGWGYILGRAYRLTGKVKYAEVFWQLFESWREQNPPNLGPHWISAQEVAIRLMALIFSLYVFHPYLTEDPGRIIVLTETIATHAERIPPTLLYSRAQGNNHLIVEAAGLYTAGLLFPEMKQSSRWRFEGRRWLERALSKQIFKDGGYVQHSANYHRLALQAALWAIRLGQLNGDEFPIHILAALRKCTSCLGSMAEPRTGHVPNYGSNDGSDLLPLTTCNHQDYRPIIQLAHRCLAMQEPFRSGPWDEAHFWFGLFEHDTGMREADGRTSSEKRSFSRVEGKIEPAEGNAIPDEWTDYTKMQWSFPQAGLHFLRGVETWGMFRCGSFTQRPGHSDLLHLDLWWKGENIARDAGTYLYNGADPWQNGLATIKVHNTPVVDEKEPMRRAGRFLWLNWAKGEILGYKRSADGVLEYLSGRHDGYRDMDLRLTRSIIRAGDEFWMVVDELFGTGQHTFRCGWLLPDDSWEVEGASILLRGPHGSYRVKFDAPRIQCALYRAGQFLEGEELTDCDQILGWFSPTYAVKEPGLYFMTSIEGTLPLRLISLWCLGDGDPDRLEVIWGDSDSRHSIISRIMYDQKILDL